MNRNDLIKLAFSDENTATQLIARRALFGPTPPLGIQLYLSKQADDTASTFMDTLKGWGNNVGEYAKDLGSKATGYLADAGKSELANQVKQTWNNNPWLQTGAYGAGAGALLGLGSELFGGSRKKRPLSSILSGATLGGLMGAGGHYLYDQFGKQQSPTKPSTPPSTPVGAPVTRGVDSAGNVGKETTLADPEARVKARPDSRGIWSTFKGLMAPTPARLKAEGDVNELATPTEKGFEQSRDQLHAAAGNTELTPDEIQTLVDHPEHVDSMLMSKGIDPYSEEANSLRDSVKNLLDNKEQADNLYLNATDAIKQESDTALSRTGSNIGTGAALGAGANVATELGRPVVAGTRNTLGHIASKIRRPTAMGDLSQNVGNIAEQEIKHLAEQARQAAQNPAKPGLAGKLYEKGLSAEQVMNKARQSPFPESSRWSYMKNPFTFKRMAGTSLLGAGAGLGYNFTPYIGGSGDLASDTSHAANAGINSTYEGLQKLYRGASNAANATHATLQPGVSGNVLGSKLPKISVPLIGGGGDSEDLTPTPLAPDPTKRIKTK